MHNRLLTLLLSIVLLSLGVRTHASEPTEIFLVSEEWPGATHNDGTGLYWEIFRYVYEPAGIKVTPLTIPYETAVSYVQRGRADAWLASYHNERKFALYPKWHFDAEMVSVMYNKDQHTTFEGIESLTNKHVAWITGYGYQLYIDVPMQVQELNSRKSIIRMLKRGRIDYFLDAEIDINLAKKNHSPSDDALVIKDLMKLKLYPAFSNTDKGTKLRKIWDERMPVIYRTPKMKKLFQEWEFDYPFSDNKK